MPPRSSLCLVALAALLAPAPLLAQDAGDRVLSDPTYLPIQGRLTSIADLDWGRVDSSVFNATGHQYSSDRSTTVIPSERLVYGVTSELSVSINAAYAFDRDNVSLNGGGSFERQVNGFVDPTFGLTYRVLDPRSHPLSLDVSAAYSPNLLGADITAAGQQTVPRGGYAANARLSVGYFTPRFTVQGFVDLERFGSESADQLGVGSVSTVSAYWQPALGAMTQIRFGGPVSLNLAAGYFFATGSDASALGQASEIRRGDQGVATALLNYDFIPNRLVGSLVYSHTLYGVSSFDYLGDPSRDKTIDRSGNMLGLRLWYAFMLR